MSGPSRAPDTSPSALVSVGSSRMRHDPARRRQAVAGALPPGSAPTGPRRRIRCPAQRADADRRVGHDPGSERPARQRRASTPRAPRIRGGILGHDRRLHGAPPWGGLACAGRPATSRPGRPPVRSPLSTAARVRRPAESGHCPADASSPEPPSAWARVYAVAIVAQRSAWTPVRPSRSRAPVAANHAEQDTRAGDRGRPHACYRRYCCRSAGNER